MMGISIWQLLIILAIIVLIFGTKRIRSMGGDLGAALKSFKKSMHESDEESQKVKVEFAKDEEDATFTSKENSNTKSEKSEK